MANNKNYKGSLRLDWINKDLSLYYEIDEKQGKGVRPVWVPKNDIRVAEPRILKFAKSYGDPTSENMLIKGDNLLVLRSLVEMFKGRKEKDKVKCIYIDPPFNTGNAFERYDDNLKHSEWLTMMRDRLYLLRKLLRKDGLIFVQIDKEEQAYLKVILDEIFGRENFVTTINIEMTPSSGVKRAHKEKNLIKNCEYILFYKNNKKIKLFPIYDEWEVYDTHYSIFLKDWKIYNLKNIIEKKFSEIRNVDFPKIIYFNEVKKWIVKNANSIYRSHQASKWALEEIKKSKWEKDKILKITNKNNLVDFEILKSVKRRNGELGWDRLEPLSWNVINGKISTLRGDLWLNFDKDMGNINKEGEVSFSASKKPERLISDILKLCSEPNDIILDSFAGSGTTGAVAHKTDRRWIMVEIGRHAEELIMSRLQRVINGEDTTGISKDVNWQGGGGFKYYKLGESVIHEQDMNWALKAEEMAEAVFLHFQYKPTKAEWLKKENMYLGRHQFARYHFALSFTAREVKVLTEDLYEKIIAGLDKEKFKHLTIFTNVALAVPPESLDERVLVKKIPAAILREYNLL